MFTQRHSLKFTFCLTLAAATALMPIGVQISRSLRATPQDSRIPLVRARFHDPRGRAVSEDRRSLISEIASGGLAGPVVLTVEANSLCDPRGNLHNLSAMNPPWLNWEDSASQVLQMQSVRLQV
jgi:hypothetical protein